MILYPLPYERSYSLPILIWAIGDSLVLDSLH